MTSESSAMSTVPAIRAASPGPSGRHKRQAVLALDDAGDQGLCLAFGRTADLGLFDAAESRDLLHEEAEGRPHGGEHQDAVSARTEHRQHGHGRVGPEDAYHPGSRFSSREADGSAAIKVTTMLECLLSLLIRVLRNPV